MPPTLLLFDIDGTLIKGATRVNPRSPSFEYAFDKLFGIKGFNFEAYPNSDGTTDYHIFIDVLTKNRFREIEATDRYTEFLHACTDRLEEYQGYKDSVLPGVKVILGVLAKKKNVVSGVLTGNGSIKAQWKLKKTGLDKWLKFGAYGDYLLERKDLFPVGLKKAEEQSCLKFEKENIFIIGDTKHDVGVAKAHGVKCIAVATGRASEDELKSYGADFVLKDLTKTKEFFKIIGIK